MRAEEDFYRSAKGLVQLLPIGFVAYRKVCFWKDLRIRFWRFALVFPLLAHLAVGFHASFMRIIGETNPLTRRRHAVLEDGDPLLIPCMFYASYLAPVKNKPPGVYPVNGENCPFRILFSVLSIFTLALLSSIFRILYCHAFLYSTPFLYSTHFSALSIFIVYSTSLVMHASIVLVSLPLTTPTHLYAARTAVKS